MATSNYDPTNPPDEIQAYESARDLSLEINPPADPVEREVVEDWLSGNINYAQTEQYNELVDAIYCKQQQDELGTN